MVFDNSVMEKFKRNSCNLIRGLHSALALVVSKINVGTTGNPNESRPQFFIKIWSYISGESWVSGQTLRIFLQKLQK